MAESRDPNELNQPNEGGLPTGDVPVEEDSVELEAPRRAASAQFVVDAKVGSEAALREAMDPANQSLAEALRLSFRVLQMVMVVLVVLFFASGFQTVDEGQSGVLTRWGAIVERDGQQALMPGLRFSGLPYPISEFVVFQADNRSVELRQDFWPRLGFDRETGAPQTLDQATEQATIDMLRPDQIGYVITGDGDIGHIRLSARYGIDRPITYVENLRDDQAEQVVRLALKRGLVHTAAQLDLQGFVDLTEQVSEQVKNNAQSILDQAGAGITLASVTVNETTVPLAIRRIFGELPRAQEEAQTNIERARQRANEILMRTAGERYRELDRLILRYEEALQLGEESRAERILAEINQRLEDGAYGGRVAQTIQHANAYRSHIDRTLGNEYRRFESLVPAFLENPELVIKQRWLETYSRILSRRDAEIWYVPPGVGNVRLDLASLHEMRELRQRMNLDRKERQSMLDFYGDTGVYIPMMRDFRLSGPGRQLEVDEEAGRVRPRGRSAR